MASTPRTRELYADLLDEIYNINDPNGLDVVATTFDKFVSKPYHKNAALLGHGVSLVRALQVAQGMDVTKVDVIRLLVSRLDGQFGSANPAVVKGRELLRELDGHLPHPAPAAAAAAAAPPADAAPLSEGVALSKLKGKLGVLTGNKPDLIATAYGSDVHDSFVVEGGMGKHLALALNTHGKLSSAADAAELLVVLAQCGLGSAPVSDAARAWQAALARKAAARS